MKSAHFWPKLSVSGNAVRDHQRVVAGFDWGFRMRAATIATTKSR